MNTPTEVLAKVKEILDRRDGPRDMMDHMMDNELIIMMLVDVTTILNDRVGQLERRLKQHGLW